jgi:hypothetical protein
MLLPILDPPHRLIHMVTIFTRRMDIMPQRQLSPIPQCFPASIMIHRVKLSRTDMILLQLHDIAGHFRAVTIRHPHLCKAKCIPKHNPFRHQPPSWPFLRIRLLIYIIPDQYRVRTSIIYPSSRRTGGNRMVVLPASITREDALYASNIGLFSALKFAFVDSKRQIFLTFHQISSCFPRSVVFCYCMLSPRSHL